MMNIEIDENRSHRTDTGNHCGIEEVDKQHDAQQMKIKLQLLLWKNARAFSRSIKQISTQTAIGTQLS